jgi:protein-arginine kinase activator protein McsA
MSTKDLDLRESCHACEEKMDDNHVNEFIQVTKHRSVYVCDECTEKLEADLNLSQFYVRVL